MSSHEEVGQDVLTSGDDLTALGTHNPLCFPALGTEKLLSGFGQVAWPGFCSLVQGLGVGRFEADARIGEELLEFLRCGELRGELGINNVPDGQSPSRQGRLNCALGSIDGTWVRSEEAEEDTGVQGRDHRDPRSSFITSSVDRPCNLDNRPRKETNRVVATEAAFLLSSTNSTWSPTSSPSGSLILLGTVIFLCW